MASTNRKGKGGPNTPAGKARSSRNALKHGCTSARVILEHEDPADFAAHAVALRDHFKPHDSFEHFLVDEIISGTWHLLRIRREESRAVQQAYPSGAPENPTAQRRQALTATVGIDSLIHLSRYGTAKERRLFRFHRELRHLQASRDLGVTLIPGSFRLTVLVDTRNQGPAPRPVPEVDP